jgi:hypothetical protein
MAAVTITCPKCHKTFKGRLELEGRRARCPGCDHAFVLRLGDTLKVDPGAAEEAIKAAPAKKARAGAPAVPAAPRSDIPAPVPPPSAAGPPTDITASPPPASPTAHYDPDDEDNPNPYGVTTPDLRARCPSCANPLESEDAVVCLYCGYNTQTRITPGTKKIVEATAETHIMWLLPGLLCVLGIVVLAILCLIYCITMASEMWDSFLVHESLRIWIVIIALSVMWGLGQFAFSRLIMNPTPPEETKE